MRIGLSQIFLLILLSFLLFGNFPRKFDELAFKIKKFKEHWEDKKIICKILKKVIEIQ